MYVLKVRCDAVATDKAISWKLTQCSEFVKSITLLRNRKCNVNSKHNQCVQYEDVASFWKGRF